jgi:hypothetical protein
MTAALAGSLFQPTEQNAPAKMRLPPAEQPPVSPEREPNHHGRHLRTSGLGTFLAFAAIAVAALAYRRVQREAWNVRRQALQKGRPR